MIKSYGVGFSAKCVRKGGERVGNQQTLPGAGAYLDLENKRCLATGLIVPSQKVNVTYEVFVSLQLDDSCTEMTGLHDAYCPCVIGCNTSRCTHICALVWLLKMKKQLGRPTCTQQLSRWVDPGLPTGDFAADLQKPVHEHTFTQYVVPTDDSDGQPPKKRRKGARQSDVYEKTPSTTITRPSAGLMAVYMKLFRNIQQTHKKKNKHE